MSEGINYQLDDNKTIVANCRNKTIITCYHESNNKRAKKKILIPVSIYIMIFQEHLHT